MNLHIYTGSSNPHYKERVLSILDPVSNENGELDEQFNSMMKMVGGTWICTVCDKFALENNKYNITLKPYT